MEFDIPGTGNINNPNLKTAKAGTLSDYITEPSSFSFDKSRIIITSVVNHN